MTNAPRSSCRRIEAGPSAACLAASSGSATLPGDAVSPSPTLLHRRQSIDTPTRRADDGDPVSDYSMLAAHFYWGELLGDFASDELQLLDVGCGSGRWLDALALYDPAFKVRAQNVAYFGLDPSKAALRSIDEKGEKLFAARTLWNRTIQDPGPIPSGAFDVAWSIHSLYAVDRSELDLAMHHIVRSLRPDGVGVIVLSEERAFYGQAAQNLSEGDRLTIAADVRSALTRIGVDFQQTNLVYEERFHRSDRQGVAHFVWKEAIGNSFPDHAHEQRSPLIEDPVEGSDRTSDWIDQFRDGDTYVFPQNAAVITVNGESID